MQRLIDADELEDKLRDFVLYEGYDDAIDFEIILYKINECQTIGEDHQKHGKWTCIAGKHATWECSNCHKLFNYPYLYCPECGAKMHSWSANF